MLLVALVFGCTLDTDPGDSATLRTLDNCGTDVADDLPTFYTLFRCVTATIGSGVTLATEDLPPHPSNYWEDDDANYVLFDTSRGTEYRENPNKLAAQAIVITIPDTPVPKGIDVIEARVDGQMGTDDDEYPAGTVGVALDGVALFDGLAAPGDDIVDEAFTFDLYNAHPEQRGVYHYHTVTPGPLEALAAAGLTTSTVPGSADLEIYGILCDGTVVLGCTEADGSAVSGALDAQGGHLADIVGADGATWFAERYHTHVCESGHRFTPELQYYDTCGIAPSPG
jgi:hypothetical protein